MTEQEAIERLREAVKAYAPWDHLATASAVDERIIRNSLYNKISSYGIDVAFDTLGGNSFRVIGKWYERSAYIDFGKALIDSYYWSDIDDGLYLHINTSSLAERIIMNQSKGWSNQVTSRCIDSIREDVERELKGLNPDVNGSNWKIERAKEVLDYIDGMRDKYKDVLKAALIKEIEEL
jgi:hypothetical protein